MINGLGKSLLVIRYPMLSHGFVIHSHLTTMEKVYLYRLCMRIAPRYCLEIGSYVGASAYFISAALSSQKPNGRLLCVDTWANDAMTEGSRDTWREFGLNTKRYSRVIVPFRGYSTKVVDEVRQNTENLDLLFIDGDHTYIGVKADWEAYKAFLRKGSVVIFHDYGWAIGVQQVVHEDVMPLVSGAKRLPNMWWGTISQEP